MSVKEGNSDEEWGAWGKTETYIEVNNTNQENGYGTYEEPAEESVPEKSKFNSSDNNQSRFTNKEQNGARFTDRRNGFGANNDSGNRSARRDNNDSCNNTFKRDNDFKKDENDQSYNRFRKDDNDQKPNRFRNDDNQASSRFRNGDNEQNNRFRNDDSIQQGSRFRNNDSNQQNSRFRNGNDDDSSRLRNDDSQKINRFRNNDTDQQSSRFRNDEREQTNNTRFRRDDNFDRVNGIGEKERDNVMKFSSRKREDSRENRNNHNRIDVYDRDDSSETRYRNTDRGDPRRHESKYETPKSRNNDYSRDDSRENRSNVRKRDDSRDKFRRDGHRRDDSREMQRRDDSRDKKRRDDSRDRQRRDDSRDRHRRNDTRDKQRRDDSRDRQRRGDSRDRNIRGNSRERNRRDDSQERRRDTRKNKFARDNSSDSDSHKNTKRRNNSRDNDRKIFRRDDSPDRKSDLRQKRDISGDRTAFPQKRDDYRDRKNDYKQTRDDSRDRKIDYRQNRDDSRDRNNGRQKFDESKNKNNDYRQTRDDSRERPSRSFAHDDSRENTSRWKSSMQKADFSETDNKNDDLRNRFETKMIIGDEDNSRFKSRSFGRQNGDKSDGNDSHPDGDGAPVPAKRVTFVPDDDLADYALHVNSGINFDNYDKIPVEVTGEDVPNTIVKLSELENVPEFLLKNVSELNYKKLTPVQKYAVPIIASRRDLMACAQTGSGKTAAFLIPIITDLIQSQQDSEMITNSQVSFPKALILAPTRELCRQIFTAAKQLCTGSNIRCSYLYGGIEMNKSRRNMQASGGDGGGCDILVATPGRLIHFLELVWVSLRSLRFFVLDEADRMLEAEGFYETVSKIYRECNIAGDENRTIQISMFSATFPHEIQELARTLLRIDYLFLAVGVVGAASSDVRQEIVLAEQSRDKITAAIDYIKTVPEEKTLVFVDTKRMADFLGIKLGYLGYKTTTIHGDREQEQREQALNDFKSGRVNLMVATNVAARGLDIPLVDNVINLDLPGDIDTYVHRIGRTGRCGNVGRAISFFDETKDIGLASGLVAKLHESNQEVPDWLRSMSDNGCGGAPARRTNNYSSRDTRRDVASSRFVDTPNKSDFMQGSNLDYDDTNKVESEWLED